MGHKFSLILSREISDEESSILQQAGCGDAMFMTDSHPTNTEATVTKIDFDDAVSSSLAEAIESALKAVQKVPDLSVPALDVPAQPTEVKAVEQSMLVGEVVRETADQNPEEAAKSHTIEKVGAAKKKKAAKDTNVKKPGTGSSDL